MSSALYNFYATSEVDEASYLPAYMASQLLRTGVLVLCKMLVQIRQHFQAAVNEVYQIHHVFNALLAANPVGIQRPEGLLLIVVGFDGPTQLVQLQRIISMPSAGASRNIFRSCQAQLICRVLGSKVLKKSRWEPDAVQLT